MKKVRFIYNSSSGETAIVAELDKIISIYQEKGYSLLPYRCEFSEDEGQKMLGDIDNTYDHILIAGGDGTVNYVVNYMKEAMELDVPIAVLPTGTANDFATALGVPTGSITKACRKILGGTIEKVDLGIANNEYFVNVFSCGLFTDVSQKTPTILKNNFGKLAYYFGGLGEIPNFRKMHVTIEADCATYDGSSLIFFVFNGRTAGQFRLAYLSEIDDGLLDVLIIKGDSPLETIRTVFHFLKRAPKKYPAGIAYFKCRELTVSSTKNEPTDMDGQPGPQFPIHIKCAPRAIRAIRPRPDKKKK